MADVEKSSEEGVESPYVPGQDVPAGFDYNAYQDQTTIKAIAEVLKIVGKHAEALAGTHSVNSKPEESAALHSTVAQEILNSIIDCKVPNMDMQKISDVPQSILLVLFQIVSRQKIEFEKEYIARCVGTKNPGDSARYSREYVTLGDLFGALITKRKEQGDKIMEDYFNKDHS